MRPTRAQLIADASPGMRGLLGYELAKKDARGDRSRGPLDGRCEVCGQPAATFILADWLSWHCPDCAEERALGWNPGEYRTDYSPDDLDAHNDPID